MDNPAISDVLPLVEEYYRKPGNMVGGNLHVVLEDHNIRIIISNFALKRRMRLEMRMELCLHNFY